MLIITLVILSLVFGLAFIHLPSVLIIWFTHQNYEILLTKNYWLASVGAALPSAVGLTLFLILYPRFGGPGEGGIAGLWFIFCGALMMGWAAARFSYRHPQINERLLWASIKLGLYPYFLIIILILVIAPIGLFLEFRKR